MNPSESISRLSSDDQQHDQVEFSVINGYFSCGRSPNVINKGTLIDLDPSGIGMLTHVSPQPGNIIKSDHGGTCRPGFS